MSAVNLVLQEHVGIFPSILPDPLKSLVLEYLHNKSDMQLCAGLGLAGRFREVFIDGSCFQGEFDTHVHAQDFVNLAFRIFSLHVPTAGPGLSPYKYESPEQRIGLGLTDCLSLFKTRCDNEVVFDCFFVYPFNGSFEQILQLPRRGEFGNFQFSDDQQTVIVERWSYTVGPKPQKRYHYYAYNRKGKELVVLENGEWPCQVHMVKGKIYVIDGQSLTILAVDPSFQITDPKREFHFIYNSPYFFHANGLKLYFVKGFAAYQELFILDCESGDFREKSYKFKLDRVHCLDVQGEILALGFTNHHQHGVRLYHLDRLDEADSEPNPFWDIRLDERPKSVKLYRDRLHVETTQQTMITFVKG